MENFNKVVNKLWIMFEIVALCAGCIFMVHQYDQIKYQEETMEIVSNVYDEWIDKMEDHQSEIDDLNEAHQEEIAELKDEISDLREELAEANAMVEMLETIFYDYDIELELVKY